MLPKTDRSTASDSVIRRCQLYVRFTLVDVSNVPQADICGAANEALFDHLVGQREQGGWDCKAECFGGLQVDEKVELIRQHYG
jgi:hypothetical protein